MGRWINVYQASSAWIRIDQSETCLQPFFSGSPTHRYSHDSLIIFSWFSHDFLYLCFLPLLRILFLFPLLFFSFFLLLSLLAFSPLLPLLPLFLVLFLSQSSTHWCSHNALMIFSYFSHNVSHVCLYFLHPVLLQLPLSLSIASFPSSSSSSASPSRPSLTLSSSLLWTFS